MEGTLDARRGARAGVLAHTEGGGDGRMRTMVVDAVSGVHFLQRDDGRTVVGGNLKGYAVATGSDAAEEAAPTLEEGAALVSRAANWLPRVEAPVAATTLAYRVLPSDGYPAVGWKDGAYVCAAHSAITLAPVVCALAAAELAHGLEVDILEPWRPGRFSGEGV